jgi:hypothetical protein
VVAPGVLAVPTGKTTASPTPSNDILAPVESDVLAAFPIKDEVAFDDAGETLVQEVGEVAASELLLLASKLRVKDDETIAALAVCGTSTATKVLVVSATNATKAGSFPHIWLSCLYSSANISGL